MTQPLALIIDDEPDIRELVGITLERMQIQSMAAENLKQSKSLLQQHRFDFCLTDLRLPDGDGIEFIEYLQKIDPQMPVAVITAHGSMETAIQALKLGAFDFLTKPVDLDSLRSIVNNALTVRTDEFDPAERLIGDSDLITELRLKIKKLSRSQAPVHITGESGTGKELVARMIHDLGPRSDKPFVPVNCGAIPHELMESELFGHKKGSFTGAVADKQGLFQSAEGGTLFLDEVADLPFHIQVKLLRAIQERKIRPVGEQTEIAVNFRILSATHKNLAQLVERGDFRQDLYYRINVIDLEVPPLRERLSDLPLIVNYLLARQSQYYDLDNITVSEAAIKMLMAYHFPGNVRELENILERAVALCDSSEISVDELNLDTMDKMAMDDVKLEAMDSPLDTYLIDIEKKLILSALDKTGGNKTAAAKALGISFRALRYRLEKLDIG